MKISLASILVKNQDHALSFYTETIGFEKKKDSTMGDYRWLTVASPEGMEGVELLLEPPGFAPAAEYQKALYEAGIPAAAFQTDNIQAEVQRLEALGVLFKGDLMEMDNVSMITFDDTCGNYICLTQHKG